MSFDEMGRSSVPKGAPQGAKRQPAKLDDAPVIFDFHRPQVL
jgi:hypothetical protein